MNANPDAPGGFAAPIVRRSDLVSEVIRLERLVKFGMRINAERYSPVYACLDRARKALKDFDAVQRDRKGARGLQGTPGLGGADGLQSNRLAAVSPNAGTERQPPGCAQTGTKNP